MHVCGACTAANVEEERTFDATNHAPATSMGPRNAPVTLQDAENATSWCHAKLLQRSWIQQLLLLGLCSSPATTLLDSSTAASGAMQRCNNASGRCNCCFWGYIALLQRFRTLQLLILSPRHAPVTLPANSNCCFWSDATLQQLSWIIAISASRATQGFSNAPRRYNYCCCGHTPLLQRYRTLQMLLVCPRKPPATPTL